MTVENPAGDWLDRLQQRPEIFPHQLDLIGDKLLLVELSAAEVSAASFLDQRILQSSTKGAWVSWQSVADIIGNSPARNPPRYIFHAGHCGSTLLSRLLQMVGGTQNLREPLPLRALAQDFADASDGCSLLDRQGRFERLQVLSKLWRRGSLYTVIKATSICTDLLPQIHMAEPGTRSVFVYNKAEAHLSTLLAGENALVDLRGFAKLRLQRLKQKSGLDIQLNELDSGKLAALSWLSETSAVTAALAKHREEIAFLEFESFLADPADSLGRVLRFLKIPASEAAIDNAVSSKVLQTYSKAPEHRYDAQTRAAILEGSRSKFGKEIDEALAWLENLAGCSRLVAESLQQFS